MTPHENIAEKLGLDRISDDTAMCLLNALYKVEEEQGYLNESITTLVSYLHYRKAKAKKKK